MILGLYNGMNAKGESFEQSEEVRRYLAPLVKDASLAPITNSSNTPIGTGSSFYTLPEDLWFITYEAATVSSSDCRNGETLDVVPVT